MKLTLRSAISIVLASAAISTLPLAARAQEISDNYIGVGAATDGFVINSRIVVGDQLSFRPAVITDFDFDGESDVTVLLPVTYDFASPFKNEKIKPFAGVGLGGTNEGDGDIGAIATGGVDYQLTDRLVANGSVNWLLFDDSDAVFTVGMGYRF